MATEPAAAVGPSRVCGGSAVLSLGACGGDERAAGDATAACGVRARLACAMTWWAHSLRSTPDRVLTLRTGVRYICARRACE